MDIEMEDAHDTSCVFQDSIGIDFDYEYDVAKFYDFTRLETYEEIKQSEQWFQCAKGYPPSPALVDKFNWNSDDLEDSSTSSSVHESQSTYSTSDYSGDCEASTDVSYASHGSKGSQTLKYKAKCSSQTYLSSGSRLLRPTASQLAKQNHQRDIHSTRTPRRCQKLENSLKSTREIVATKRQKLEIGCLRKVARLRHPLYYSHKLPQKVGSNGMKSLCAKSKIKTPKEPSLETGHRAQQNRSKNATNLGNHLKSNGPSGAVLLEEKSNPIFKFKVHPINKKPLLSNKQDMRISHSSKCKTTTSKELKISTSQKLCQRLPTELLDKKGLKTNVPCLAMKENKNSNVVIMKTRSCHPKHSQFGERKPNIFVRNNPAYIRSFAIQSN